MRVVDFAGRVIQNHDQVVPALVAEPLVLAAVDVQQHAWHGPPLAAPSMLPTSLPARDQAGPLQRLLHPRIAQLDAMLFAQLLVKVPDVQVIVAFLK